MQHAHIHGYISVQMHSTYGGTHKEPTVRGSSKTYTLHKNEYFPDTKSMLGERLQSDSFERTYEKRYLLNHMKQVVPQKHTDERAYKHTQGYREAPTYTQRHKNNVAWRHNQVHIHVIQIYA